MVTGYKDVKVAEGEKYQVYVRNFYFRGELQTDGRTLYLIGTRQRHIWRVWENKNRAFQLAGIEL